MQTHCRETDCSKPIYIKKAGQCRSHYEKIKRSEWKSRQRPKCPKDTCNQNIHAKGLCSYHYNQERKDRLGLQLLVSDEDFWNKVDETRAIRFAAGGLKAIRTDVEHRTRMTGIKNGGRLERPVYGLDTVTGVNF